MQPPRRRLEPEVDATLRLAGWFPGRNIGNLVDAWAGQLSADDGFEIFEAAVSALSEYGGLVVRQRGPGQTMARQSFDLHPPLALGEKDRFARFSPLVGQELYPLGEGGDGHYFLAIAEGGAVYGVADALLLLGTSIEEALSNLIVGRRAGPIVDDDSTA